MLPSHGYDFVQWTPNRRGLYESNYLKANSPDGKKGIWLKHNILAPSDEKPAMLELWCVLFDQDRGAPRALKQMVPMSKIETGSDKLRIEGDQILLTDRQTKTKVNDKSGTSASWDLKLTPKAAPLYHLPYAKMYTAGFPKKKPITPVPRLKFDGKLDFDGESVEIKNWIGIRGHNWGTEHAYCYAYGNCNLFREDESALVDMYTAKIRLGPVKSPWLSGGVLRIAGKQQNFNGLRHLVTRDAVVDLPEWRVTLKDKGKSLETVWRLDPAQTIGLRYLHPDGKVSFCYNTKFADLRIRRGALELTSDQAELEFLYAEPIPGIPLYGEELL